MSPKIKGADASESSKKSPRAKLDIKKGGLLQLYAKKIVSIDEKKIKDIPPVINELRAPSISINT